MLSPDYTIFWDISKVERLSHRVESPLLNQGRILSSRTGLLLLPVRTLFTKYFQPRKHLVKFIIPTKTFAFSAMTVGVRVLQMWTNWDPHLDKVLPRLYGNLEPLTIAVAPLQMMIGPRFTPSLFKAQMEIST